MLDIYTRIEIKQRINRYYKILQHINKTKENLTKYIDQAQTPQEKEYWVNRLASHLEDQNTFYNLYKPLLNYQDVLSRS